MASKAIERFLGPRFNAEKVAFRTTIDVQADLARLKEATAELVRATLKSYYSGQGIEVLSPLYNFIVEPLKNARVHSDLADLSEIQFDYFFNSGGIVFSYYCCGSYFRSIENKRTWENRTNCDKHEVNIGGIGAGFGREFLFSYADFLYVNTRDAKLYSGLKTTNEVFFKKRELNI